VNFDVVADSCWETRFCERITRICGCIVWTSGGRQLVTGKVAVVRVSFVCLTRGNDGNKVEVSCGRLDLGQL
jgi:hypothetical protein